MTDKESKSLSRRRKSSQSAQSAHQHHRQRGSWRGLPSRWAVQADRWVQRWAKGRGAGRSRDRAIPWRSVAIASACALALGAALSIVTNPNQRQTTIERQALTNSTIPELLAQPATTRTESLKALAAGKPSDDRNRARYLLAVTAIETKPTTKTSPNFDQEQAQQALEYLDNLEQDYPTLGGWILWQRSRALRLAGDEAAAQATLEQLLQTYGEQPIAAEALYELGNGKNLNSPQWQQLLTQFPNHPRAADVAIAQLAKTNAAKPAALPALRVLIRHHYRSDITDWLDRTVKYHKAQLTPEDWQHIGFGYWETLKYRSAGFAYAKAPSTAHNRYRQARSLQLGDETQGAIAAYRNLAKTFPDAPETGRGLLHLARLVSDEEALSILTQTIEQFPDRAAEALYDRAKLLDRLGSQTSASQARQSILTQYSHTDIAATLRWDIARNFAKAGKTGDAIKFVSQLVDQNPDSSLAPKAGFWLGKWQQKIGNADAAQRAFSDVLKRYPWTYYAWRSATLLGWEVGNFATARSHQSEISPPIGRGALLSGSETLRELYALGLERDAWSQWQVEFQQPEFPNFADQYTDGVLRTAVGDYLDGMFMLTSLADRETADDRQAFLDLQQQDRYWETLYPFPYQDLIVQAATDRQIDPLLVVALIRQESRFVADIRSFADAVGLMQVLPSTAEWITAERGEPAPKDLTDPADNIRIGTLYFRYVHEEWDDSSLLAIASYNAGPGNVEEWVDRFGLNKPNPDLDEFVYQIPFDETQDYVTSVFGNYWNYLRLYDPRVRSKLDALRQD